MQILRFRKSIGALLILILLSVQAQTAYAIFSPYISDKVSVIKQDVQTSRLQNGVGSLLNVYEKLAQKNKELIAEGKKPKTPGSIILFLTAVKESIIDTLLSNFSDDFWLILGSFLKPAKASPLAGEMIFGS